MRRRELSDNIIEATEATASEAVELLGSFNVGECWEKPFNVSQNPPDTATMMKYINRLKQEGLDIGKGDSKFGYKMPLPEKDISIRYLQIFRRK